MSMSILRCGCAADRTPRSWPQPAEAEAWVMNSDEINARADRDHAQPGRPDFRRD
jgi:hypothetical protein